MEEKNHMRSKLLRLGHLSIVICAIKAVVDPGRLWLQLTLLPCRFYAIMVKQFLLNRSVLYLHVSTLHYSDTAGTRMSFCHKPFCQG